jgi:hypothetical protein
MISTRCAVRVPPGGVRFRFRLRITAYVARASRRLLLHSSAPSEHSAKTALFGRLEKSMSIFLNGMRLFLIAERTIRNSKLNARNWTPESSLSISERPDLLRLEKCDLVCCERVEAIFELGTVAIRKAVTSDEWQVASKRGEDLGLTVTASDSVVRVVM